MENIDLVNGFKFRSFGPFLSVSVPASSMVVTEIGHNAMAENTLALFCFTMTHG
jgi:hypothetical protein